MHRLRITVVWLTAFLALSASATVYYAKPGGTGAGTSWTDAADLETAVAAATASGDAVYVAKGFYKPSAAITVAAGVSVYGGFAGADMSETPAGRDLAANVTLVSGDKSDNDVWVFHHPATGESEATATPVVSGGALNIPTFADDYETVIPSATTCTKSDNLRKLFSMATGTLLDGFVLTGSYGPAIYADSSATVTGRHCRCVGCLSDTAIVQAYNSSRLQFLNSSIEHCSTPSSARGMLCRESGAYAWVEGCRFVGNVNVNYSCYRMNKERSLGGCLFTRNYVKNTSASKIACVDFAVGDNAYSGYNPMTNCQFVCNSVYDTTGQFTPIVYGSAEKSNFPRFCSFVSNRTVVVTEAATVTAAGAYASIGCYKALKGCSFLWNTLSVSAPNATVAEAATVYVSRSDVVTTSNKNKRNLVLDSCTFVDNAVTLNAPSAENPHFARGVLMIPTEDAEYTKYLAVYNSTFTGSTAGPDIVYGGPTGAGIGCLAFNNVLWATGAAAKTPRVLNVGSDAIQVRNSIVVDTSLLADDITTSDLVSDDPLLGKPTVYVAGYAPVCRLGALLPGLRTTYDITYASYYSESCNYFYRAPSSSTWVSPQKVGSYSGSTLSTSALNETRPARGSTIGAVQAIDPLAESGHTFVLRPSPAKAGTVQGGCTQVCAADGSLSLTAVVTNGTYAFQAWRTTDDTLVSADNPLVISSPGAGTTVYKVAFETSAVDYTFDLGEHGTFTVSGTSVTNMTLKPGKTLVVPAYTVEDGYAVRSWTPALPTVVGSEPLTFAANYAARSVEVAPGEDLAAALDMAGAYPGAATVTLLAGTHARTAAVAIPTNVCFVGADGAVLTSPLSQTLVDQSPLGTPTAAVTVRNVTFARGAISPSWTLMRFVDCVFSNMTANGAEYAVSACTNIWFRNCLFVNNAKVYYDNYWGSKAFPARFNDCTFRANYGSILLNSARSYLTLSNCVFKANILSSGPLVSTAFSALYATRCRFEDNELASADLFINSGKDSGGQYIRDSFFFNNTLGGSGVAQATFIQAPNQENAFVLDGCSFVSNAVTCASSANTVNYSCLVRQQNGCLPSCVNCSFDRNVLKGSQTGGSGKVVSCVIAVSAALTDTAFCQCSFLENTAANGTVYVAATAAKTLSLFNCVFADADDAPAVAFDSAAAASVKLYGCTLPALSSARAQCISCNGEPLRISSTYWERDGRLVRPLHSCDAARRVTYPSYTSANGLTVVLDGETYRVALGTTTRSPTAPYATLPDMFGSTRRDRYPGACRLYIRPALRITGR